MLEGVLETEGPAPVAAASLQASLLAHLLVSVGMDRRSPTQGRLWSPDVLRLGEPSAVLLTGWLSGWLSG